MPYSGLYRSSRHSVISGVMGGIAERFGWNVTVLRLLFVLISLLSAAFPGILVYLILWLVIPKQQPTTVEHASNVAHPVKTIYENQQVKR